MNLKGNILFPILLFGSITIAIASEMISGAAIPAYTPSEVCAADTVIYPTENYKARRVGSFEDVTIADSLLGGSDTLLFDALDTAKVLTARDTIVAPDSLKEIDLSLIHI